MNEESPRDIWNLLQIQKSQQLIIRENLGPSDFLF